MSSDDEANERYGAQLASKLVACSVPASAISVRYEDVIRDYEIVISGGPLSPTQIECIDAALYPEGYLQFTDSSNAAVYQEVQSRRYRLHLTELAESMPGLPTFDPATKTIDQLARELEVWCEVEPGTGFEIIDGQLSVISTKLPLKPGDIQRKARLAKAMAVALRDHDGLIGGVIGGT
jgi:hypothetical protein